MSCKGKQKQIPVMLELIFVNLAQAPDRTGHQNDQDGQNLPFV